MVTETDWRGVLVQRSDGRWTYRIDMVREGALPDPSKRRTFRFRGSAERAMRRELRRWRGREVRREIVVAG